MAKYSDPADINPTSQIFNMMSNNLFTRRFCKHSLRFRNHKKDAVTGMALLSKRPLLSSLLIGKFKAY